MGYSQARQQLIACGKGLQRRLADLECWNLHKTQETVSAAVAAAQVACRRGLKPFPRWPIGENWLREVRKPLQTRKRCLVLQGPSRTGNTEFVRGLFPLGAVHELNCANLKHVCLDGFESTKHSAILWDEAGASLVSNNRKMFQHPQCMVDLGHSPTGQHVKRYFLGNACSILTTNRWHEDVARLAQSDQEWLRANMVVFDVTAPLWETPPPLLALQDAF